MKEKREALEQILSRQLDWIVAAETRVGLLLPIETALLGGLLTVRLGSDACHGFEQFAAILGIGLLVAALGCLAALAVNFFLGGIQTGTMNPGTFTEVAFSFDFGPKILLQGVILAVGMGLIGGFFLALRAVRMKVVDALREV